MSAKTPHRLSAALDAIISAQLRERIGRRRKRRDPDTVADAIERAIRELVLAHQAGRIDRHLPAVFTAALRFRPGGTLHFTADDLSGRSRAEYQARLDRFEAILSAALHAGDDPTLRHLFQRKLKQFDTALAAIETAIALREETEAVWRRVPKPRIMKPRDEDEAVAYLKDVAEVRTELDDIRARYEVIKAGGCPDVALEPLRRTIHKADKGIATQRRRAAKYLLDQAASVHKAYRSTPAEVAHVDTFMAQQEALERFAALFDGAGDTDRRDQIRGWIEAIATTRTTLSEKIDRRKQAEAQRTEARHQEAEAAYGNFLKIREHYTAGDLRTARDRRRATARVQEAIAVLKAGGHRVRAREAERFLNATGLVSPRPSEDELLTNMLFYRRWFYILAPTAAALAVLCAYLMARLAMI